MIWKHHFIKAYFCYALTALFFRRRRKTNAAREKPFAQFSFLTIFTALSLHALSKDKRSKRKTFLSIFFLFIFTTPFLKALSKDKRGNRKMLLSIFLLVHLHRSVFTGGIERQTRQEKNVSFNFPFCLSSPPYLYMRYRKTNAAREKRFFQFSFWFIFTAPFLQAASKDKRGNRKTFLSIFFLFIFTTPFLQALS